MPDLLYYLTSVFFFFTIVFNAISFLSLFESRGYNARRLFIYLRETRSGKNLLTGRVALLKWIIIFSYISTVFYNVDKYYHFLVFVLYLALFINVARHIKDR